MTTHVLTAQEFEVLSRFGSLRDLCKHFAAEKPCIQIQAITANHPGDFFNQVKTASHDGAVLIQLCERVRPFIADTLADIWGADAAKADTIVFWKAVTQTDASFTRMKLKTAKVFAQAFAGVLTTKGSDDLFIPFFASGGSSVHYTSSGTKVIDANTSEPKVQNGSGETATASDVQGMTDQEYRDFKNR